MNGNLHAVGVLGGTFDPPHYGHLRLAEEAADGLELDKVHFIPAGQPYHRTTEASAPQHRLEMVRLATADNPRFVVDDREVRRLGPSYTVETLTELRAEWGGDVSLVLLMGTDAFRNIATWRRHEELFDLAHVAIVTRAGTRSDWLNAVEADLRRELKDRLVMQASTLHQNPAGRIISAPMTPLEISATAIRSLVVTGASARYLAPSAVLDYIESRRLYRGL